MQTNDDLFSKVDAFLHECKADEMPAYKRAVFIYLVQMLMLEELEKRNAPESLLDYFDEMLIVQQDAWKITGMVDELFTRPIRIELAPRYFYEGKREITGELLEVFYNRNSKGKLIEPFGRINMLTMENSVAGISLKAIKNIELI